jgi:hypothetical protein
MKRFNYELTKYPDIFKGTYWGNFKEGDESGSPDVIRNRNEFVEFFSIVRKDTAGCVWRLLNEQCLGLDHHEAYRTQDGKVILVVSVYDWPLPSVCFDIGFAPVPYLQIYHKNAQTYVMVLRGLQEVRDIHKRLKGRVEDE